METSWDTDWDLPDIITNGILLDIKLGYINSKYM